MCNNRGSTRGTAMTPLEIKFLVMQKWGTITDAARELHTSRCQLSYVIQQKRKTAELREILARALEIPIDELFGDDSNDDDVEDDDVADDGVRDAAANGKAKVERS